VGSPTPDTYHVALKAFVCKDGKVLICFESPGEKWDLPGGRIAVGEFGTSLEDILKREVEEELGSDFAYRNNGPVAVFRFLRPEITALGKPEVRVFMIGFELQYLGGEITLSEEHSEYRWTTPREAAELLPDGQSDGMRAYIQFLEGGRKRVAY